MNEKRRFSAEEADEWIKSREWANGLQLVTDESVNAEEFATQYAANKSLWDTLFAWIRDNDVTALDIGRYDLVPGRLWINVNEYIPLKAEDAKIESHRKFIDLQYIFAGEEFLGLVDKATPEAPYDEDNDRTFFTPDEDVVYHRSDPTRFFLFFPTDKHQPSVRTCENPGMIRKIVVKIEYSR